MVPKRFLVRRLNGEAGERGPIDWRHVARLQGSCEALDAAGIGVCDRLECSGGPLRSEWQPLHVQVAPFGWRQHLQALDL